jgi:hypothetical protein
MTNGTGEDLMISEACKRLQLESKMAIFFDSYVVSANEQWEVSTNMSSYLPRVPIRSVPGGHEVCSRRF